MTSLPKIVIITGPTASGKSAVAVQVAQAVGGEIISADSAAVYRRLDIGTAKPTKSERDLVPHHLIDVAEPDEGFNAMTYVAHADDAIRGIKDRGRVPIVVGGTGLYIKALIFGLIEVQAVDRAVRGVREALEGSSTDLLWEELMMVDADSAGRINPNDRVRIVRALEIYRTMGVPKSRLTARHGFSRPRYDARIFGLFMERASLYRRVEQRVDEMIRNDIVREVRELLSQGLDPASPGLSVIGYREIVEYLTGKIDLQTAIYLIKRNTRRYAKRQMTWFGRVEGIGWVQYPYDVAGMIEKVRRFMDPAP